MLVQLAVLAIAARQAAAATCYDRYGYAYNCNGLAYGARVGIAAGIAVGVFVLLCLCGVWRRRQLKSQWAKYRPPALPYNNNNNQTQGGQPQYGQYQYGQSNSYANNPPPPSNFGRQYENQNGLPQQPPQTYQPSMAGQYGYGQRDGVGKTNGAAAAGVGVGATEDHEHGYEWAQAREQERIEREQAEAAGGAAPPGYEVANQTFAPPAGPPPGKQTSGTV